MTTFTNKSLGRSLADDAAWIICNGYGIRSAEMEATTINTFVCSVWKTGCQNISVNLYPNIISHQTASVIINTIQRIVKNMSEVNKKRLLELVNKPENSICADCDQEGQCWNKLCKISSRLAGPEWASYTIGVFLCVTCAGIHRCLGSHISRIKSIRMDNWDRTQVASMEDVGNKNAKAFYEKYVPVYYKRPKHTDPQWVCSISARVPTLFSCSKVSWKSIG